MTHKFHNNKYYIKEVLIFRPPIPVCEIIKIYKNNLYRKKTQCEASASAAATFETEYTQKYRKSFEVSVKFSCFFICFMFSVGYSLTCTDNTQKAPSQSGYPCVKIAADE